MAKLTRKATESKEAPKTRKMTFRIPVEDGWSFEVVYENESETFAIIKLTRDGYQTYSCRAFADALKAFKAPEPKFELSVENIQMQDKTWELGLILRLV